jgi:hypothetical protein
MRCELSWCLVSWAALLAADAQVLGQSKTPPGKPREISLWNGRDFSGWRKYSNDRNANLDVLFSIEPFERHLVIKGKPAGYLITAREYENYELTLEWRWGLPREAPSPKTLSGLNSGVLLHVTGPDKLWPKSVEAQLQTGRAGDFWLIDGFGLKVDPQMRDPMNARHYLRTTDDVENSVGDWNQYVITCQGRNIKLTINGREVNHGEESELTKGKIALQSEGAEIHFRNIKLRLLQ